MSEVAQSISQLGVGRTSSVSFRGSSILGWRFTDVNGDGAGTGATSLENGFGI